MCDSTSGSKECLWRSRPQPNLSRSEIPPYTSRDLEFNTEHILGSNYIDYGGQRKHGIHPTGKRSPSGRPVLSPPFQHNYASTHSCGPCRRISMNISATCGARMSTLTRGPGFSSLTI